MIGEIKTKGYVKKTIFILIVMVLLFVPFKNLFIDGVYNKNITGGDAYKSGVQCLLFFLLTVSFSFVRKDRANVIIGGSLILFLSMQGVLIPYLAVYVYFESICFIGHVLNQKVGIEPELIRNFISGLCTWGALAIICSLLKHGTIVELRLLTLILVIVGILFNSVQYELMPHKLLCCIKLQSDSKISIVFIVALCFLSVILAAKTNNGQDFDSLWYMLKPEYMLVGENSFYDYLGYSAYVFYYPKLVEFFLLPVSGLGDYSFILIGTVFIYNLFIVLTYKFFEIFTPKTQKESRLLMLLVLFSIPSLTSVAASAKGDVFGAFLTFSGIYFFLKFIHSSSYIDLIYSIISFMLCTGTKLTFLLWGGIAFLVFFIYYIFAVSKLVKSKGENKKKITLLLANGIIFIFGIYYRTYLLTGYPTYPTGVAFWNKIGFSAKYAMKNVGSSSSISLSLKHILERLYDFIFNPTTMDHTVMSWQTNVALIMILVAFCFCSFRKGNIRKETKILIVIAIIEQIVAIYYMIVLVQPDGNYFYCPVLITSIACWMYLYDKKNKELTRNYISFILFTMLCFNIPLFFISSWSWAPGINLFTREIIRNSYEDNILEEEYFKQKGYYQINEYISNNMGKTRILMSGNEQRIHGAVESFWSAFTPQWCSSEIRETYDDFKKYIEYAGIKGFVLSHQPEENEFQEDALFQAYALQIIQEDGYECVVKDENADLYILLND